MSPKTAPSPPIRGRVAVIYNPVAGFLQRGRLRRFLRHLRGKGHEVLLRRTEGPGHATEIAASLDPEAIDVVVAAGGDGTINEVANGLIDRPIPMAIAPLGTANVFAFELGLGLTMRRAAAMPSEGHVAEIRPALANGRGFLLMVSAGPDARVVSKVDTGWKRLIGKGAYVLAALREIVAGSKHRIRLRIDGREHEAGLAIITHASHYAGPFVIAPDTRLGDDTVTVVLLRGNHRFAQLRYGLALLTNRIASLGDATVVRARDVCILGPEGEPIQSDGDVIGHAPMTVSLGDGTLRVLVPDVSRVNPVSSKPAQQQAATNDLRGAASPAS